MAQQGGEVGAAGRLSFLLLAALLAASCQKGAAGGGGRRGEFGVEGVEPGAAGLGVRDEVEAVVCIVVAEDLERRGHGCGARSWQAEGENLHRDAVGREWLVHRWSELCVVMEV